MPTVLLPASAAAFAPRSPPNVVLNRKVEPWLTAALKRINRVKRPLNNVTQHTKCLTETLSSPNAIWTLCWLLLPVAPGADLRRDENPLVEALANYHMMPVEAYVVHIDMVSRNEVALKLTPETIKLLVNFHRDVYSVDTAASTWTWTEKDSQVMKLQEEFVQAANKFVYRTEANVLEGLEEEGAGELFGGRTEEVKSAIMSLFVPLLPPPPPPPPRVIDVLGPPAAARLVPGSTLPASWWHTLGSSSTPIESWKVLPSTSPTGSSGGDSYTMSANSGILGEEPSTPISSSYSSATTTTYSPSTPVSVSTGVSAPASSSPSASSSSYSSPPRQPPQYHRAAMSSAALAAASAHALGHPCSSSASPVGLGWLSSALPYEMIM